MYDVIVIGAGAAGMFTGIIAARRGLKVVLLEKNKRPGKKLNITGKGRCNVTNNCSVRECIENIPTGGKFLNGAINTFSPADTARMFEQLGVKLKTERGNRVFPQSDKAGDIVAALKNELARAGAELKTDAEVISLCKNSEFSVTLKTGQVFTSRSCVLSTGGTSYPLTGSTGDGYRMASGLGHTIVTQKASLVALESDEDSCRKMQGLTLKNVKLSVFDGGAKPIYDDFGELLFTHFGLSGPLVLSASAHMRDFEGKNYYVTIDLKPALDEKKLDARLLRDFTKFSNRDFSNALEDLFNRLMIPVIIEKSRIPPDLKVHSITRQNRIELIKLIKSFKIEIKCPRPVSEAIITSGGVELKEINPKTMESKLIPGLFFAGEIIDADAYTGGFNLQIAWSTGYVAGNNVRN